jgi:hypothetical protein
MKILGSSQGFFTNLQNLSHENGERTNRFTAGIKANWLDGRDSN